MQQIFNQSTTDVNPCPWSATSSVSTDWTLHQIAPYIGRMKTTMARYFVEKFTRPGDIVVDPFCGSGVIPLEAAALGRNVIAGDWNPYGTLLTRAKLFYPKDLAEGLERLNHTWELSSMLRRHQDLRLVPSWVRKFFHRETLRDALSFRDACIERGDDFLLACLLGILHHQRQGFLSYPSSHLVPYLRDKNFPRRDFPELYERRDVFNRMRAKLERTLRRIPEHMGEGLAIYQINARRFPILENVQAVITSPPYMNELDYVRDNRLRLWFIKRTLPILQDATVKKREEHFSSLLRTVCTRLARSIRLKGFFVLVLGEVTRSRKGPHPASIAVHLFKSVPALSEFRPVGKYVDRIPDVRRARRDCRGTKCETILIFQRT